MGDEVMVGDQVVLLSNIVQLPLHASRAQLLDNEDSFEVNASASLTPWKLLLFLEYHRTAEDVLKGGDVVRLFHAEQEKAREPFLRTTAHAARAKAHVAHAGALHAGCRPCRSS